MSEPGVQRVVDGYLNRLREALSSVSFDRREQIVNDVTEHIAEARRDEPVDDEDAARALLARIGTPEEIAAAALDEEPNERQHLTHRRKWLVATALALCVASGATAVALTTPSSRVLGRAPESPRHLRLLSSSRFAAIYAVPTNSYTVVINTDVRVFTRIVSPAVVGVPLLQSAIRPELSPRSFRISGTSSVLVDAPARRRAGAPARSIVVRVGSRIVGTINAPAVAFTYEFQPPGTKASLPVDLRVGSTTTTSSGAAQ